MSHIYQAVKWSLLISSVHFWILLIQFHYCFRSLTVGCASHAGRPADDLSAINRYFLDLATPWFIEYFDLIDLLLCSMLPATSSSDCLRTRLMVIHLNPGPPKLWKEHFPQSHFGKRIGKDSRTIEVDFSDHNFLWS